MVAFSERMVNKAIEICKESETASELMGNFGSSARECAGAVKTIVKMSIGDEKLKYILKVGIAMVE